MNHKLPQPIPYLYPELRRVGNRKRQVEALVQANGVAVLVFSGVTMVVVPVLANWLEGKGRAWFGWGDGASLAMEVGIVVVVLAGALGGFAWFGVNRARVKIRRVLAERGEAICVPCGYDLGEATEPRCPECGAVVGEVGADGS